MRERERGNRDRAKETDFERKKIEILFKKWQRTKDAWQICRSREN